MEIVRLTPGQWRKELAEATYEGYKRGLADGLRFVVFLSRSDPVGFATGWDVRATWAYVLEHGKLPEEAARA